MTKRVINTAGVFYDQDKQVIISQLIETNGITINSLEPSYFTIPKEAQALFSFLIDQSSNLYIKNLDPLDFSSKLTKHLSSTSEYSSNCLESWLQTQFPNDQLDYDSVSFLLSYYYYQSLMNCLDKSKLTTKNIEIVGISEPDNYKQKLPENSSLVNSSIITESSGINVSYALYSSILDKETTFDPYHLITPLYYQSKFFQDNNILLIDTYNQTNLVYRPTSGGLQVNFCKSIQEHLVTLNSENLNSNQINNLNNLSAEISFYLEQLSELPKTIYISDNSLGFHLTNSLKTQFDQLEIKAIQLNYPELTAFIAAKIALNQPYLFSSQNRFKLALPGGKTLEAENFPYDV